MIEFQHQRELAAPQQWQQWRFRASDRARDRRYSPHQTKCPHLNFLLRYGCQVSPAAVTTGPAQLGGAPPPVACWLRR
jgi:hypothetical protein